MPPRKNERSLRSQSARPPTSRTGAPNDGSPLPATTPPGPTSRVPFGSVPAPPSGPLAAGPSGAAAPAAQELVSALTLALRAAFPDPPARRARVTQMAQPIPDATTDDDEEDLIFHGYPSSQDPVGRYRARIPDDSDHSSSSSGDSPPRRDPRYPRHVNPSRAPTGSRGQRLFTTRDPPTRRDFRNALLYVDRASRQSRFFGTCDVVELQTLELFLHVWDSDPPLRPSAKLRVFDRVRLLYHVALTGWQAALQGYADPTASYLLGAPLPTPQAPPSSIRQALQAAHPRPRRRQPRRPTKTARQPHSRRPRRRRVKQRRLQRRAVNSSPRCDGPLHPP
ncbi:splicing factor, arginine/serine-rich 19-like [Ixodes scapularis]|uniref:splicing factor, arginine/serine-rich 19-like n=1 Tax=Ixodes scapularis TaxID=6945 RepID=UPI001A9F5A19|nr:splicing factor, arginine/serine-rich 19-like [Ixodes scapularis]